ncbi:MAG: MBL fold metallo-hydrolase [Rhizobacter sp.]|nr:MBL fold metallo-hydrolase [Bacteriovorax sp.]
MAKYDLRNNESVSGSLFVDTTCIDCETCFHIGPDIFEEKKNLSVVVRQPETLQEWQRAKEAILSCPTNSIGVKEAPAAFRDAVVKLPRTIVDGIYFCGYTSPDSFGATSYLIRHPQGNILVDSPRFNAQLVSEIEKMGGIDLMFLTHKDDVADHKKFREHFKCRRVIHKDDLSPDTADCEIVLEGSQPTILKSNLITIPTPGHSLGHMCLLYLDRYLFTGDHLFYNREEDKIYASKSFNWYSWDEQLKSNTRLLDYHFEWIFPGHGGWVHKDSEKLKDDIRKIK